MGIDCRFLSRAPGRSSELRCGHPQVHVHRGVVSAGICAACGFRSPAAAAFRAAKSPIPITAPREHGDSVAVLSQRDGGRLLFGRTRVAAGTHPCHECDVVIPYHAGLQWLPAAIESILSQNFASCQLHLINDDSPEDDGPIRRRFERFGNVHWYRNRERVGPFTSVNRIFAGLRYDYLVIQDADHRLAQPSMAVDPIAQTD